MEAREIRNVKAEEFGELEQKHRAELIKLTLEMRIGQKPHSAQRRVARRDLARLLTIKREQELGLVRAVSEAPKQAKKKMEKKKGK